MDLYDYVCDQIQKIDGSVRYIGLVNKMGTRIKDHYRSGLKPLLKENELNLSALESALRMNLRRNMQYKLGKPLYSFTLYEKVKRITIPLYDSDCQMLMISFDIDKENEHAILAKIFLFFKKLYPNGIAVA